jgi:hypothetical protein
LTRRFDIGPIMLALGAVLLLVALFLDWYGPLTAWNAFELTDVLLAALAIAALVGAVGLLAPELEYVEQRFVVWIVGAVFVLVAAELLDPPPGAGGETLGTGAWLALASAIVMVLGAVLALGRVSFAVAVEGRDRRTRVAPVDHQGPPTETGTTAPRSSESLLNPREPSSES